MTLTNEQLERAAVAAETWKQNTNLKCKEYWVTDNGFNWPACAAVEFDGSNTQAHRNCMDTKIDNLGVIYTTLNNITSVPFNASYTEVIDRGEGDAIAHLFRAAKT